MFFQDYDLKMKMPSKLRNYLKASSASICHYFRFHTTRVPQDHSYPLGHGVAGAGVAVGMLWGGAIPVIKNAN